MKTRSLIVVGIALSSLACQQDLPPSVDIEVISQEAAVGPGLPIELKAKVTNPSDLELSYNWDLESVDLVSPYFDPDDSVSTMLSVGFSKGTYYGPARIRVKVSDGGLSDEDSVDVTIVPPPAEGGFENIVVAGASVRICMSDPNDTQTPVLAYYGGPNVRPETGDAFGEGYGDLTLRAVPACSLISPKECNHCGVTFGITAQLRSVVVRVEIDDVVKGPATQEAVVAGGARFTVLLGGEGQTDTGQRDGGSDDGGSSRFVDKGNGVLTDTKLGIDWQQDASNQQKQIQGPNDSDFTCDNLSLGGHNHWRLPSFDELFSLVDTSRSPMWPAEFEGPSGIYWTGEYYWWTGLDDYYGYRYYTLYMNKAVNFETGLEDDRESFCVPGTGSCGNYGETHYFRCVY